MTLKDVLNVISGGTNIRIYVGCINAFSGKMADVSITCRDEWERNVGIYMDCEVIRLNVDNNAITIAV